MVKKINHSTQNNFSYKHCSGFDFYIGKFQGKIALIDSQPKKKKTEKKKEKYSMIKDILNF